MSSKARPLLVLLAIALFSIAVTACGGAGNSTGPAPQTSSETASTHSGPVPTTSVATPTGGQPKDSDDGDDDANSDDDLNILDYGHAANEADKRAVTAVVRQYYTAAAADDGAKACSLIYSLIAEMLAEDSGQESGSTAASGETCAMAVSKLLKPHQQQMAADLTKLEVTRVRVEGSKALAVLYLGTMPEDNILLHREGGTWKLEALFPNDMP